MEGENQELRAQLQERTQLVDELQAQLKRREEDLNKAIANSENDAATKATFQKQIRDFQTKLDDLTADMESERESRKRLEHEKRDLIEEIESLRNEILDTTDLSQEMVEREKKRDEELSSANRALEQARRDRETAIVESRSKHAKEMEELTNQLENAKRQVQSLSKDRQQLQSDLKDRDNEMKNSNSLKQEIERKRRQLETQVQDLQHKFNESERIKNEILDKAQRSQQDIEGLNAAFIESEQRLQNTERIINALQQENQEWQENLQDENRQKMNAFAKLRQAEELLNEFKDQSDEKEEERLKLEAKLNQIGQQNVELRRELEKINVEQMEELRLKLQREKEALLEELNNSKSVNTKLIKSNQKLTNDIADSNVELERYRVMVQNVERQRRTYEEKIREEKIIQERLRQERDRNEQGIREKETQRLNLLKELDEKQFNYEESEKRYKILKARMDTDNEKIGDVGRHIQDLEKNIRALGKSCFFEKKDRKLICFLESMVDDQKQQIVELEDELQTSEDARLRLEVNSGALKQQIDKITLEFNAEVEDRTRALTKRLKEYEGEVQEEQKSKLQVLQQRKKLESDLHNAYQQLEEANRLKEDALRNARRFQVNSIDNLSRLSFALFF